ncbi:MAG: arsenate reductase ArsC [Acidobacteria bacterium]|nr:arsenate reductase ArsC [Acidobacteriota bacterium]MCZ6726979.1 arsenate reductase ArsC [Acidobacteriota bacterium]
MKRRALILCTGNSARSQMAEAWLRELAPEHFEVASAGSRPSVVHPLAVRAMAERHIDISGQRSKHLREFIDREFDFVITVCERAAQSCPDFPGPARRLHWSFSDPAAVEGGEKERLESFRRVRDAIEQRLREWLLEGSSASAQDHDWQ